ncbi:acetyl-CoA carboxylase biotin carboxyl carrier protein [Bacillus marasmi]|uniref:acetyl-CoA carboxylase biotin carboxyl carrier protein n=1 Tax=Bacillus marasmi TaxID=1926279 RepID=UPI0011CB2C05|nr:acetyl-CoA carboxylase biotin carboxyl carrier protein [Bacillus marasmi]
MLKVQEIRELIKLVDNSSINEFVYEHDDYKIKMKKNAEKVIVAEAAPVVTAAPAPVASAPAAPKAVETAAVSAPAPQAAPSPAPVATADVENLHKITSPMVGTFYAAPSPDADAYVKVGQQVSDESIVCIVEAMKLFNEIEAEVKGEIVEILVKDGQLVEYGQPLFLVKPE